MLISLRALTGRLSWLYIAAIAIVPALVLLAATPAQADDTAVPPPTAIGGAAVVLPAGTSLLTWPGAEVSAAAVAQQAGDGLVAIYRWDTTNGRWQRYLSGLPKWTASLRVLAPGDAYVFITNLPVTIELGVATTE